jgi:hypothetical protein
MVAKVALWRCKCGTRVKVVAVVNSDQLPAVQMASCPKCGDRQTIQANKIKSVTEDKSDIQPCTDSRSSERPTGAKEIPAGQVSALARETTMLNERKGSRD